ncbi:MAG TPA: response regulator [Nitrososphaeraceae archaeon]|nr:response regulator [Nitrososphaeraceae archaeon]
MVRAKKKKQGQTQPFDVVVLDYKTPKLDGLQVAKQILNWNPMQRVIFASAFVMETLRDSVKELEQVVELIQKPFRIEVLIDMIEDKEIFDSVRDLASMVKKIKDVNNPSTRELRDLFKALTKANKGKAFDSAILK